MQIRYMLRKFSDVISKWLPVRRPSINSEGDQQIVKQQHDTPSVDGKNGQNLISRRDEIRLRRELARQNFKPFAVVICERKVPSSITMYGFMGGEQQRIIHFPGDGFDGPEKLDPETYSAFARANLPDEIKFMGKPVGYVVNYSPKCSIQFDLEGKVVRKRNRIIGVGKVLLRVGP